MDDPPIPGIDLWNEDGLLFETAPALFVHLDREPIVFTVRGIKHFAARFRHVGVDLSTVVTAADFRSALQRWDEVELALLQDRITARRRPGVKSDPYNALQAVLDGDIESAKAHVAAMEHRARANLQLVQDHSQN